MSNQVHLPPRVTILDALLEDFRSLLDRRRGWNSSDEDLRSVGFEDFTDSSPVRDLERREGGWAEDVEAEELGEKQ